MRELRTNSLVGRAMSLGCALAIGFAFTTAACGDDDSDSAEKGAPSGGRDGRGGMGGDDSGSGGNATGGNDSSSGGKSTGGSTGGGSTGGSGTGGSSDVTCAEASDCPGEDTECSVRTCTEGVCGTHNEPEGTQLATQTKGDCKVSVCGKNGAVVTNNDDNDVPDDGKECTIDSCIAGNPKNLNLGAGEYCSQGTNVMCDGAGECVECNESTDCAVGTCEAGKCVPT